MGVKRSSVRSKFTIIYIGSSWHLGALAVVALLLKPPLKPPLKRSVKHSTKPTLILHKACNTTPAQLHYIITRSYGCRRAFRVAYSLNFYTTLKISIQNQSSGQASN